MFILEIAIGVALGKILGTLIMRDIDNWLEKRT